MKQHTTPEQTAKLIELGLLPKSIIKISDVGKKWLELCGFSIGEFIEMLPGRVNGIDLTIDRYYAFEQWLVYYDASQYREAQTELIYALFGMIVKLKEEGVI